jgi:hypothetical protein
MPTEFCNLNLNLNLQTPHKALDTPLTLTQPCLTC